ncbi:right-handed parallel beta-helix repeat-containing protein [Paenibacillus alginolyticus]|uniref:Right-handed parallel beta-helix repeat-containing protein n=1 Tax=Paenibacillus alginolyticus TaxID=59839 RepID=A0ABT4G901_9BACL|nr:right-handed parallel beta-helix repeat-containing protein [Paenibacillus alginolyticus]MCY9664529.1 right-handed parallel beta-helix repeat-containing protein [Paenibacillus alginolyticus]MCY9692637.1 right-handed parallel beta-helix repeat-containing protein [Paenibacillus alginolyticus]MEC0143845.1 right-handed parallel beta-helix repeat-containing protein [Paenibacillus alginolyticus]
MIKANLGDLDDIDLSSKLPTNNDILTYDSNQSNWIPKKPSMDNVISSPYVIDLGRWTIKNDGTESASTTKGINDALVWAKSQGINHCILPNGTYKLKMDNTSFSCIVMQSGMHFEMAAGCVLQLDTNSSPWYRIFYLKGITTSKISGGTLIGDKKTHIYQLGVKFVRGGVNADGSLNNNPNFIRSEIVDRYANPGLLKIFRLWNISGITNTGYSFYQYKDTVSSSTLAGFRTNGLFAPAAPTGRGWFAEIENANKMIFAIDITSSPLSDAQISQINAKIDAQNYTHEFGHGIELDGSNYIEIDRVEISNCTGDAIFSTWLEYKLNPADYTQEQMGSNIYIHDCNLHHCRRQGVSIVGSNDVSIMNNKIHHIGKADDGVTEDGTSPMFGIDIESMWSETNIPTWRPEINQSGLELNTRIYIRDNYISNNSRGHFVNADGINVVLENNTFEGYNVGGISSYQNNMYVKYLNNTIIGCELVVKGDNFVNGSVCNNGNIKIADIAGAVITNCQIKNGLFYGSSVYGYLGTPTVDVTTGTFSYSSPHGMGNGAKVSFEQWIGKVPSGISVDKLYYTVNIKANSFQVSETLNGNPVTITDSGTSGFNISRYNYGRCYISDITVERDWRNDNTLSPNFQLLLTGGVIRNITVKNYEIDIRTPMNYTGRPISVDGIMLIEGGANFESCLLSNSSFVRIKTSILGGDISLGSNDVRYTRKLIVDNCLFQNIGINFNGSVVNNRSTFVNSTIGKIDNTNTSIINNSYLENTKINLHWLTRDKSMTIAKCIFNNVSTDTNANTRLIDNISL